MKALPNGVREDDLVSVIAREWSFDAASIEYAAVGAGSYHWIVAETDGRRAFVTVDDVGQKTWFGDTYEESIVGLRGAFDTAVALRRNGLDFVVAPTPTLRDEPLVRLDPRRTVALFPFVDGDAGTFGSFENGDRLAVLDLLARLHHVAPTAVPAARHEALAVPGRRHLEAALRDLDEPWTGGPLSEPARAATREASRALADLLALADRLAEQSRGNGVNLVVTHGEPHPGNVMRTGAGHVLVDWDTVAVAPPERDLWMLDLASDDAARYTRATGTEIDDAALDFYRLTWELKDIAEYLNVLRSPHEENDDTRRDLGAVRRFPAVRDAWSSQLA